MFSVVMLTVISDVHPHYVDNVERLYAECRYAVCHYVECRGVFLNNSAKKVLNFKLILRSLGTVLKNFLWNN